MMTNDNLRNGIMAYLHHCVYFRLLNISFPGKGLAVKLRKYLSSLNRI